MSDKYLSLEHVSKSFTRGERTTRVLQDVSLHVGQGEFVCLIGHSGCGKSTLLNIVAGLTPATEGAVLLENREVYRPGPDRAVVFQNHSLLPWLTVQQNVSIAVDKVFRRTMSKAPLTSNHAPGPVTGNQSASAWKAAADKAGIASAANAR